MTDQIKAAFVAMTGVPDAWTNPALMQTRNGFIQGWEAGAAHEREACANVCDKYATGGDGSRYDMGRLDASTSCAATIRARGEA